MTGLGPFHSGQMFLRKLTNKELAEVLQFSVSIG